MKYNTNTRKQKVNCLCYNVWAENYQSLLGNTDPPKGYRPPHLKFQRNSAPEKHNTSKFQRGSNPAISFLYLTNLWETLLPQAFSNFYFLTYSIVSDMDHTMCHIVIQISKLTLPYPINYNQAKVQIKIKTKFINLNADIQLNQLKNSQQQKY